MVAKSVLADLRKQSKAPPKPPEKAPEKAATKPAPGPAAKPSAKDPKGAKPGALPDAALLDDEAAEGDTPAAAPSGIAAWLTWLPPGRKRWIALGSGTGGLVVMIACAAFAAVHFRTPPPPPPPTTIAGAAKAMDGATVTVSGRTVHLENIDAPPAALVCKDGAWSYRCGEEARRALDTAIGNAPVECVTAHPSMDGPLTALCRNDTGLDLAAIQVESGWAVNDMRAPSRYIAEESRAESAGNGLWRNDFAHPELWRGAPSNAPKDSVAHRR